MLTRSQTIALAALALLTLGVVMVNSAAMQVVPVTEAPARAAGGSADAVSLGSILTGRPAMYAVVALAALAIAAALPAGLLDRLASLAARRRRLFIALAAIVLAGPLLAVYLPGVGVEAGGARRWIAAPIIGQFQPSEIAKWGLIVALAAGAVAAGNSINRVGPGLFPLLGLLALVAGLVIVEDLGTGVLMAAAGGCLLIAAGVRLWLALALAPPALAAVAFAILSTPYRVDRVVAFVDPFTDPGGKGFHIIQSMTTIAGGGPFGRGLGHGLQKFGYLPEDTTDFLFAVICEELGLAGAALVIFLYVLLFAALAAVARAAATPVQRLVCLGVLLTLAGQTLMNLAVVTGLGPTKGIALPLLSSGGTGWVLTAAALGLVIAIDRRAAERPAEPASAREPSTA